MARERVIIAGAGGISNAWLPHIVTEKLQVVAVVDLRKEAAQAQIQNYKLRGAAALDNVDQALRDHAKNADFLLDLTIPDAHETVTIKALKAGLHVVGEKPMAASMAAAKRMVNTSEQTGKLFMTSQSRRWDSNHKTVATVGTSGKLGQLTTFNCDFYLGAHFGGFRDEMASPLILDMSIHHFDLVRMFSGKDPVAVYAEEFNPHGSWYKGDVAANCIFEMTGGVYFAYRGSWCAEGFSTSWNGDWRIIGSKGTMLFQQDQPPKAQAVAKADGFSSQMKELPIKQVPVKYGGMHGGLRQMLDFLRTGKKPETECHDNIKSLAMVFGVIESSKTKRRVKIKV